MPAPVIDVWSFIRPPRKLLKSKTHQASVSGGAGFGSLQDFSFLSSLVPSTPERYKDSYPAVHHTNSVQIAVIHSSIKDAEMVSKAPACCKCKVRPPIRAGRLAL